MIRVRLCETYNNWYWDSGNGVTLRKDDREGQEVNEDNHIVRLALDQGFLEVVTEEELNKVRESLKMKEEEEKKEENKEEKVEKVKEQIMTDSPPKATIKEVVTPDNTKQMEKIKGVE